MGVTLWIVVAFAVGVLFGRLTARGSSSGAGPTGLGSNSGGGPGASLQFGQAPTAGVAGNPNGAYRVMLLDSGPNKIRTIKAVRAVTRLDLKDAKDSVDSVPRELIRVDSMEQAQAVARAFQGVATVRLDGPPASGTAPSGFGYTS